MHAITHTKENMKDTKEREKYEMLEYATFYSLQSRKGYACLRIRYGADAISMFGLIMLYLQHIILPYQKQLKYFDSFNDCFSCLTDT